MLANHMQIRRYFPEAYDGRLQRGDEELSIVELATSKELPPILYRKGEWVLTAEGIDSLLNPYFIEAARFGELDWLEHMEEKNWVNIRDFACVLDAGRDFVRWGILKP